jgi:hypothetical protein
MNLNKICPHCEVEYLPHIDRCADCGAVLLRHDEFRKTQQQKKQLLTADIQNGVAIREGDLNWLSSLNDVLIDAGIPSRVITDATCKKGCRGSTCRLVVSKEDTERAQACITEYYMELHPELRASNELINQGKCPACGSPVGPNDKECLDCGLTLVIIEEEREEGNS